MRSTHFPHKHKHPLPSVFDKRVLIHTKAFTHTRLRTNQQPEMKGINTLQQTSEESGPLPGGSLVIGPDKQPRDNNNNKASVCNKCSN